MNGGFMLRLILSVVLLLVSAALRASFGDPEQLPLDVQKEGAIATISIDAKEQYVYYFEIGYGFKEGNKDASHIALELSGMFGRDPNTGNVLRPGVSVPLELKIFDMGVSGSPVIFLHRVDVEEREGLTAGSNNMMFYLKLITSCRLKPGHYRVDLMVLKAVPELSNTPVIFTYSLPAH
jgi:hypothetical protein